MPDSALTEALQEAYASAPKGVIIHPTLELRHPNFSSPIRVVRDYQDLTATLEADAPVDPSTQVTFVAFAFEFTKPEVTPDGRPQITVQIDNVDRQILTNVELAVGATDVVEVTYREYLSTDLTAPQNDPPIHMSVTSVIATPRRVSMTAGFGNLANKQFPGEIYDAERFPGLVMQ